MLNAFDRLSVTSINEFVGRSYFLDRSMVFLTDLDIVRGGIIVALLCWAYWRQPRPLLDDRLTWVRVALGTVAAVAVARGMQNLLPIRLRPLHEPSLQLTWPIGVDENTLRDWSSFPSDHGVVFGALVMATFLLDRRIGAAALLWTLVFILFPRLFLGIHYPSDLLAGLAIGAVIMLLAWRVPAPGRLREFLRNLERTHHGLVAAAGFVTMFFAATMFRDVRVAVDALKSAVERF